MRKIGYLIACLAILLVSCSKEASLPKPYGYFRLEIPDTAYVPFSQSGDYAEYPYDFALSQNAEVQVREEEPYWINLYYPALDATIHCSYKPVNNNLGELLDDANDFVYRNPAFANSIQPREYPRLEDNVYAVVFELEGNTASSCQFFVVDSARHFFRGSVYCNCLPNADSLAPVNQYLRTDVIRMVETFKWRD